MRQGFKDDTDFFKSIELDGTGNLRKTMGHKYVKRTGVPGSYKYWYKDPKTGKLITGKQPTEKKKEAPKEISKELKNKLKELMSNMRIAAKNNQKSVVKYQLEKINKMAKENKVSNKILEEIQKEEMGEAAKEKKEVSSSGRQMSKKRLRRVSTSFAV